jgi:hypothetical protein
MSQPTTNNLEWLEEIEKLAALEHNQWIAWSKNISESECISEQRIDRWKKLWVDYVYLTDEEKDQDRYWAKKVLSIIADFRKHDEEMLIKMLVDSQNKIEDDGSRAASWIAGHKTATISNVISIKDYYSK